MHPASAGLDGIQIQGLARASCHRISRCTNPLFIWWSSLGDFIEQEDFIPFSSRANSTNFKFFSRQKKKILKVMPVKSCGPHFPVTPGKKNVSTQFMLVIIFCFVLQKILIFISRNAGVTLSTYLLWYDVYNVHVFLCTDVFTWIKR